MNNIFFPLDSDINRVFIHIYQSHNFVLECVVWVFHREWQRYITAHVDIVIYTYFFFFNQIKCSMKNDSFQFHRIPDRLENCIPGVESRVGVRDDNIAVLDDKEVRVRISQIGSVEQTKVCYVLFGIHSCKTPNR